MAQLIVVLLLFLVTGFPLAFAWSRKVAFSLMVAPLVAALIATAAVLVMLAVGGPLLPWFLVLALALLGLVPVVWRRRWPAPEHSGWRDVLWLVVPLSAPLSNIFQSVGGWDAHSIYWLHAVHFARGAAFARDAIGNPAYSFSHTDYPPLPSASVAAAWSVLPGFDFHVAQLVGALLSFSGVAVLAYAVRLATAAAGTTTSRVAAILVGLATWSTAPYVVVNGYSDALWSTTLVAATILLLVVDGAGWFALLPLLVAALSKNEGMMMALVLVLVVTVRHLARRGWRAWRGVWPVWMPVVAIAIWSVTSRILGATSDLAASPYLKPSREHLDVYADRFPKIVSAFWQLTGPTLVVAAVVAVVGWILLRRARAGIGVGSEVWLLVVAACYAAILFFVYLTTPNDIDWHLATSADRVTLPLILFACVSAIGWGVVASNVVRRSFGPLFRSGASAPAHAARDRGEDRTQTASSAIPQARSGSPTSGVGEDGDVDQAAPPQLT